MGRPVLPPSLLEGSTKWRPWPGHAAVSQPPCGQRIGVHLCGKPALCWTKCRCGIVFAFCGDCAKTPEAARQAREAHRCDQVPAPVEPARS